MPLTIAPRIRTLALLILAVAAALLVGAGPASAHAALTGSDPAQGSVVDKAPDQVTLTFSEQVAMNADAVRVLDPQGKRVDTRKPTNTSATTYALPLHGGLPDGTYTVTYQIVSADSHPVAGAYTFSIGAPSATSVPATAREAGGGVVGGLYGFGRYLSYAGFIVLVGGAAFVLVCWPRGAGVRAVQRLVVSGWVALTGSTLFLLLLRGSYTGSGKVGDIFALDLLAEVLQTKTGAALVSRLLLLAAAALFIAVLFGAYDKRDDDEKRDLAFGLAVGGTVVAAGLAASWAMAEHASSGLQPAVAMPVDIVHLVAVATWLGGLCALLVALYRGDAPVEPSAVRRYSRVAFASVVALVVTGVYQSWRQLGSWSAFTETRYGQLLLVKIGLVALLVGLAWLSRRWTARLLEAAVSKAAVSKAAVSKAARPKAPGQRKNAGGKSGGAAGGTSGGSGETAGAGPRVRRGQGSDGTGTGTGDADDAPAGRRLTVRALGRRIGRVGKGGEEALATAEAAESRATAGAAAEGIAVAAPAGKGARVAGSVKNGRGPRSRSGVQGAEATAGDTERSGQLARQRAAVDAARRKRLRDDDPNRVGLRRSVLAEAGVAVVLLAVTTALTSTEPGRTEQEAKAATAASAAAADDSSSAVTLDMSFDTGGPDGKGVVSVDLNPARTGANTMHVYVTRPNGRALDVPEVKLAFTLEARKIGPLTISPDRIATGHWSATDVQLPVAGEWEVAVTVRTSDIDQVTVSKNAQIG